MAVGRWLFRRGRDYPSYSTGGSAGREPVRGVDGLERALQNRPDLFVGTLTEKLLTFALGRRPRYYDARPSARSSLRPRAGLFAVTRCRGVATQHAVSG